MTLPFRNLHAILWLLLLLPATSGAAIINQFYVLTANSYHTYRSYDYVADTIITETKPLSGLLVAQINLSNNTVTLDYSNVLMDGLPFRANESLQTGFSAIAGGTLVSGTTGEPDYMNYGNATLDPFPTICVECGYEMRLNLDADTSRPRVLAYHEYNPFDTGETHFELFVSQVPLPAAAWLFISGLFGLIGFTHGRR